MNNTFDISNHEQELAYNLISSTNSSFFLTGRAGTGKTTFLKSLQTLINKRFIILAPTGIAAINAGGETIHSFFRFPLHALDAKEKGNLSPEKKEIIRSTDTIIIDEVSMVRCDMIDAIDRSLRRNCVSHLPFGGKQVVFCGDMFQLEPILRGDGDKDLIKQVYKTEKPYFFKAKVFERMKIVSIEFKKIYRQTDTHFLKLLEGIRNNSLSASDLEILNTRVQNYTGNNPIITLTSHNETAKKINLAELEKIKTQSFHFNATINGEFDEKNTISEKELLLKIGAQVMFTRNDPTGRWVNGTLGEISALSEDSISVKLVDNNEYEISKVTWENIKYQYDRDSRSGKKEVVGTFTQYPVKLAWAVTIHKSQGLTFENVRIDFSRGIFANGQTYVALSRARTLEGLYLTENIRPAFIKTSNEVAVFANDFNHKENIEFELQHGSSTEKLIRNKDYDKAAEVLFKEGMSQFASGNSNTAYNLFNRSLDLVVCDDHFFGNFRISPDEKSESPEADFNNSVLMLYAGHPAKGLAYIDNYLKQHKDSINGLYVKSRILTLIGNWQVADKIHDIILKLNDNNFEPKLYFRGAIINETKCNIPSLSFLQYLMFYAPKTIETHKLLRQFHRARNGKLIDKTERNNSIVSAFNEPLNDETFNSMLISKHSDNDEIYNDYLEIVLQQIFD
jgi:hypothetical protein